MSAVDTMLRFFTKEAKDPNAPKPPPGSRSEREAKIKDKAGLVINIFALLLAVNAWYGGKLSSTVLNNTISANNQWSWYQAKNIREVLYTTQAMDTRIPENKEKFESEAKRMKADKEEIMVKAKALEAERDDAKKRSPWIGYASTAYQLSIVLLSASILAVSMPLFWGSFVVAAAGMLLSSQGIWLWF
ncbi:MAG: DUF4337 family protein [Synechococcaceae bacterium WB8_1B_057]|nr:DUF4337 family protein [Synechococcaceae bacterium WB6_1A_059]NDG79820.1 DUF4337 family protein [Synechococcaceae bacterium WB8_1B_057]